MPSHLQRDDIQAKLQDWIKLSRYSHTPQIIYSGALTCLHLTDLSFTAMQMSNEIFLLDPYRNLVFFWYNVTFVVSHGILFTFRVIHFSLSIKLLVKIRKL